MNLLIECLFHYLNNVLFYIVDGIQAMFVTDDDTSATTKVKTKEENLEKVTYVLAPDEITSVVDKRVLTEQPSSLVVAAVASNLSFCFDATFFS